MTTLQIEINGKTDCYELLKIFQDVNGFISIAYYEGFCYIKFTDVKLAERCVKLAKELPKNCIMKGVAKTNYEPCRKKPDEIGNARILHISQLPSTYTYVNIKKLLEDLPGCYRCIILDRFAFVEFLSSKDSLEAAIFLRSYTNFAVSKAKSIPYEWNNNMGRRQRRRMRRKQEVIIATHEIVHPPTTAIHPSTIHPRAITNAIMYYNITGPISLLHPNTKTIVSPLPIVVL